MPNRIYVPLKVAAKKHNVKENVLTRLIAAGMIEAKEEAGETLVAMDKTGNGNGTEFQTKEQIIADNFSELQGHLITLSEASKKYKVPRSTMQNWVSKSRYISPLDSTDYPSKFDEAGIAYLVDLYRKQRAAGINTRLLDVDGLPYQIRHPDLAAYRRRRKKQ